MKITNTIALLAVLMLAGAAFAQDGGGPPPPPGDQAGGPGGRMRRPMMGGPMILNMKAVQKELKLTDDQISQLKELLPGRRPVPPSGDDQGAPPAPPKRLSRDEMENKIKQILTPDQYTRYRQIDLQAAGPMAFMRPDVVEKLGLSPDQKTQILTIIQADRQEGPSQGQNVDMRAAMKERRENLMKKITAVLTEDQKATWKTMLGDKFDLPEMGGPRRGPGGPGGPEGPPPGDGGGGPPPPPPGSDGG